MHLLSWNTHPIFRSHKKTKWILVRISNVSICFTQVLCTQFALRRALVLLGRFRYHPKTSGLTVYAVLCFGYEKDLWYKTHQIKILKCSLSSCSYLCVIYYSQVLIRKWRYSWSNADLRCANYIWVINILLPTEMPFLIEVWGHQPQKWFKRRSNGNIKTIQLGFKSPWEQC